MIYCECKPDATMLKVLTQLPNKEIVHEIKGKYEVVKRISRSRNGRGLIDEDPGSNHPIYLSRMILQKDMPLRGLKLLEDTDRGNKVVVLCPKLEDWIIRAAQDSGLDLRDPRYNLPDNPTRLHREITFDLRKLERLVQELANTPRFKCLLSLLRL